MPSDGKFGFSVLVADKPLSEYAHPGDDSRILIESILWAPTTYQVEIKEFCKFSGEIECQKWPVTPYEIKVYTLPCCELSWFKVYVDGVKVAKFFLKGGMNKTIKGFPAEDDGYNEFLFSLPRFAESETDRVRGKRTLRIGKIEVVRYEVTFSHTEMCPREGSSTSRRKEIKFTQANKKDVVEVTKKQYTMTTTRKGRLLRDGKPYDPPTEKKSPKVSTPYEMQQPVPTPKVPSPQAMKSVRRYDIGDELGKLHVEYHMTQTLLDWDIQLIRPDWPVKDLGTISLLDEKSEEDVDIKNSGDDS